MTERLSTEELKAIRERADAATPGPWEAQWRPIPGFGDYEVSDFGQVRTLLRKGNHKEKSGQVYRLLKLVNCHGYRTVSIRPCAEQKYKHFGVHRLVMWAFVGPQSDGMHVAHLNGDPADNRLCNLAYCTAKENNAHKVDHGTN